MKGPSWLTVVPSFNLIQGMSFDYMHCVLLGVCRFLLSLWLQPLHHQELYYIGTRTSDLDDRLLSIKPPNEIQRTPRSLASTLKYWKGALICMSVYEHHVYIPVRRVIWYCNGVQPCMHTHTCIVSQCIRSGAKLKKCASAYFSST